MSSFQGFLSKCTNLFPLCKCYMFYPSNLLDLMILTRFNKNYIYLVWRNSSICNFTELSVMLSTLGQNTAISTLILNTMWYVIPCSRLGRQNKDVSEKLRPCYILLQLHGVNSEYLNVNIQLKVSSLSINQSKYRSIFRNIRDKLSQPIRE
jgi:hypothetical protein